LFDLAFSKLHWKPLKYTAHRLVDKIFSEMTDGPTLLGARIRQMYPIKHAYAFPIGAGGHVCWDREVRVKVPHALVVHAEYDKVLRLYFTDV
jgi:hypothetical protein